MESLSVCCRSCGTSECKTTIDISKLYEDKKLEQILLECTGVNISQDKFSKTLCDVCSKQLIASYQFRLQTQNTHAKLLMIHISGEIKKEDVEELNIEIKPMDIVNFFDERESEESDSIEDEDYDDSSIDYKKKPKTESRTKYKWRGFICPGCREVFKLKSNLEKHMKDMQGKENHGWICSICSKETLTKQVLYNHMRTFHKELDCTECKMTFIGLRNLARHNRQYHKADRQKVCPHCGKFFANRISLTVHIKGVHEKKREYSCHMCGKKTFNKVGLNSHMNSVHSEARPFECTIDGCGKRFKLRGQLRIHKNTHVTERNFPCEVCGIRLKNKYYLTEHRKIHFSKEDFKCEICPASFKMRNYLKEHIKKHHTLQQPATCPECGKIFKNQRSLNRHMNYHNPMHNCQECNRLFPSKRLLDEHISATHEQNRKWICEFIGCNKAYFRSSHLRHHEKVIHYKKESTTTTNEEFV